MNLPIKNTVSALVLSLCVLPPASADDAKPTFGFEASMGYQYDSNVNIAQLDANTGKVDTALTYALELDGDIPFSDKLSLKLGYGYSQTAYQEFAEFDLGIHQGHAEVGYRTGGFNTALTLRNFVIILDNDRFMDIRHVSPSVSRLFGEAFYLRAAYTNAEKTYQQDAARSAVNNAVEADAYFLLDDMRRYIAIGIKADREDAVNAELDYDGTRLKATYGHRLQWLSRDINLKSRVQVEDRDYLNVTETIGTPRRDERFRASLSAGIPLSETFSIEGEAAYVDNTSNLESATYEETVLSINFAAAF